MYKTSPYDRAGQQLNEKLQKLLMERPGMKAVQALTQILMVLLGEKLHLSPAGNQFFHALRRATMWNLHPKLIYAQLTEQQKANISQEHVNAIMDAVHFVVRNPNNVRPWYPPRTVDLEDVEVDEYPGQIFRIVLFDWTIDPGYHATREDPGAPPSIEDFNMYIEDEHGQLVESDVVDVIFDAKEDEIYDAMFGAAE